MADDTIGTDDPRLAAIDRACEKFNAHPGPLAGCVTRLLADYPDLTYWTASRLLRRHGWNEAAARRELSGG